MKKDDAKLIADSLVPILGWADLATDEVPLEKIYFDIYSHFSFMSARISGRGQPLFPTYIKLPTHLKIRLYRLTTNSYYNVGLTSDEKSQPIFGVAHVFNTYQNETSDEAFSKSVETNKLILRKERSVCLVLRAQQANPIVLEAMFPIIAAPISDDLKRELSGGIYILNKEKRPLIVRYPIIAKDEESIKNRFKAFHENVNKITATMPLFYI
jgi:hypothetical protein